MLGAVGGLALLALAWFATFHIGLVEHVDRSVFSRFADLGAQSRLRLLAHRITALCDTTRYPFLCAVPVIIAIVRRRFSIAIVIGWILLGANVTTELLKRLVADPRSLTLHGATLQLDASWPSGHTTAAFSLAACCVLVAPTRWQRAVAICGTACATAVACSVMVLRSHYPSDVLAGFLIAAIWTLLGISAVLILDARQSVSRAVGPDAKPTVGPTLGPVAGALLIMLVLAGAIAKAGPHEIVTYARRHDALVIGAVVIAIAAAVVSMCRRAMRDT